MTTTERYGFQVETPVLAEDVASYFTGTSMIDRQMATVNRYQPYRPGQTFELEPTEVFLRRQCNVLQLTSEGFVPWEVAWIMQMTEEAVQCILDHQD